MHKSKYTIVTRSLILQAKEPASLGKLVRMLPKKPNPLYKRRADIAITQAVLEENRDNEKLGLAVINFYKQREKQC